MIRRRASDENGFTLPELLVAMTIGTIVIGVLGMSVMVMLKTDDSTVQRLALSHDRQLLSNYFTMDVQSTGDGAADVATSGNTDCSGGSNLVRLQWTDSSGTSIKSAYHLVAAPSGGNTLERSYCAGAAAAQQMTVAYKLTTASVSQSGGTVTLTLTDTSSSTWDLSAVRRSSLAQPMITTTTLPGTPPPPTTTTTSSTTTTAVVAPCALVAVPTATNNPQARKNGGATSRLGADIKVTVKTSGSCGQLHLEYSPASSTITTALSPSSGTDATFSVTLQSNGASAESWTSGDHAIVVKTLSGTVLTPTLDTLKVTLT